jgi:GNAT superfamily N-acetyltransferase
MDDDELAGAERDRFTGSIRRVAGADLAELLSLMRGYCDFYRVDPSDAALARMAEALLADPEREGVQLIARRPDGGAVGFATVFWSWSTSRAARLGVMNDLFVTPEARGSGAAEALIAGCLQECRARGAAAIEWETALDNDRAQAVYDRVGATQERWLSYSIELYPRGMGEPRA